MLFILHFRRDYYLKYELANESEFHSQSSFSHHIQFQNTKIVKMLLPTVSHLTSWGLPLNEITRTTSQEIILSQPNQKLSTTWTRNSVHKHSWNCGQRAALGESNSLSVQRPLSYYLHDCGKTHIQFMRLLRFFELMPRNVAFFQFHYTPCTQQLLQVLLL